MRAQMYWPGGKTTIPLNEKYYPARDEYDFGRKQIRRSSSDRTEEVWERILKLKDFVLDLETKDPVEAVEIVKRFVIANGKSVYEEIKVESITGYIKEFINLKRTTYSYSAIRQYETLIRNIMYYCYYTGVQDRIGESKTEQLIWFSRYVEFLLYTEIGEPQKDLHEKIVEVLGRDFRVSKKRYKNESVANDFKLLKSVFGVFSDSALVVDLNQFHANLRNVKEEAPYYTLDQLRDMIHHKTHGIREKVLDIAVFQSFTGVRYSDLYQLEEVNITRKLFAEGEQTKSVYIWNYVQGKGGIVKSVPLNDTCMGLIEKWKERTFEPPERIIRQRSGIVKETYPNCLLPIVADQVFNRNIKLALKDIPSFNKLIKRVHYNGPDMVEKTVYNYDLMTSHSARHTFSHILYANNMNSEEVGDLINSPATSEKYYKHILKERLHMKALDVLNKIG